MASTGKVMASPVKSALETQVPPRGGDLAAPLPAGLFWADLSLRLVLLSSSAASLAMVLSSNQIQTISSPLLPVPIRVEAKFRYSSAITYSLGATSVVCLYSILSLASTFVLAKRSPSSRQLLSQAFLDALMAAVLGSGTGAVSSVAYIALKGNSHVAWHKVCDVFDKFCRHMGSSIALNVVAMLVLLVLVFTSTYSLYRRAR
ncbi:hypothetical protein Taro_006491 [Colocasia esculenta]|uniref:CASP-like protein n=1 Tax=Colocasia esculenta TaxID=4460 RepID=A0A843TSV4_COLES|nr:hypothetical protein [Colocasia esculenta]